ncbi:putative hydrolase of the HAD superfamily [Lipingzhangella halophila]|uniref:Putative hydrolase of the HAD superfamily n=1 Tax=Lipingzhangella halophila TaxID=1783352 RepID=A0A7W7RK23_9ACTN|nr:HAD-IA family hydrolase [Lipingzhangella halophila]MBB4933422.1 putative hydrolase of the HAD superfamily [Lipingzhangella halophila]
MTGQPGVIWDFDATLAERPGLWSGCMIEVLDAEDPGHRLTRQDLAAHTGTGFPWHAPQHPHPELCEPREWWAAITRLLAGVYQRVGYPPERADRLAAGVRERYCSTGWRVLPGAHEALRRVREARYRQVILSNHTPELPDIVARLGLGGYFDAVLTSARTGFEKPHDEAYRIARDALEPCSELWMVGDSVRADVHGPERHGIRAVLVRDEPPAEPVGRHAWSLASAAEYVLAGA